MTGWLAGMGVNQACERLMATVIFQRCNGLTDSVHSPVDSINKIYVRKRTLVF